jgi:membrane protein DedA with SNARE-associated domain
MHFHAIVHDIIGFVHDHGAWAAPVVFVLAFAESLAFISLLVPAWGALVALGAMIKSGGLDLDRRLARRCLRRLAVLLGWVEA